jgi:hypothetical protein
MGRVTCDKHGATSGPLCCKHVLEAVYGKGPQVSFQRVEFDAAGDGRCVIGHLICGQCVIDYGLSDQVSEAVWDDESRFPWVCPVCAGCLSDYEKQTKCEQGGCT